MKVEGQGLRLTGALLTGALALLAAPAVAQGAGPERPPVKAPSRLGPEPAPAARTVAPAPPPPAAASTTSGSTTSGVTTSVTSAQPVIATTAPAQPQQRAATNASSKPRPHRPPPPPKATRAVKVAVRTIAHNLEQPAAGIALVAAPTGTNSSDRLLFLGGLALLVLVLGDAAFLAMSARAIRDER